MKKAFSKYVSLIAMGLSSLFASNENANPRVVVIGAGLSGLTAAYRLQKKGVDVHVYEAKKRVGGRIFSAIVDGHTVEIGGQNIGDGGDAKNIFRLIEEFQLPLESRRVHLDHFYFDGEKLLSRKSLQRVPFTKEGLKFQLQEALVNSCNMQDVLKNLFSEEDPLFKLFSLRLAAYEGGPAEKLSLRYVETLYHMLLGGICHVHPEEEAERGYVDIVSIQGGNSKLPETLAQKLEGRIHLEMTLSKVTKSEGGKYRLFFTNDEKVDADILVLAIPCSVYGDIEFTDKIIPQERLSLIHNVPYGQNAKILVPFTKIPVSKMALVGNRCVGFFGREIPILTLYHSGISSHFTKETLGQIYSEDRPMIEMAFGDECPPFKSPQYAEDGGFFDGPVGYSWVNDPYAKGSYTFVAAGQEEDFTRTEMVDGEIVKSLFAPIGGSLYFAGEHATILQDVLGTMEAAAESGERTARMVLSK